MKNKYLKSTSLALLFLFSIFSTAASFAASSDTLTVKVTIAPSISVSIAESTLSLGSVNAGATKASTSAVTVTNDGSGINETYSISLTDPSDWAASQTAAGSETYVLNAVFDADGASITWSEANHALSTTPTACSSTRFAADQTGVNVPYNSAKKLWFQFKAPTATTSSSEQSIVVTVTAQTS